MYSLTIAFGDTPAMWRLLFKTEEHAIAAHQKASMRGPSEISIVDDFGQTCTLERNRLIGLMLEDLDQSKLAGVEMQMHTWRIQAAAQTRGMAEAELRPLRGAPQGPSVFVPGMGNGRM
jgi:hypothetical protein